MEITVTIDEYFNVLKKTCLQMGLTNVRHAMVGSLGLVKNWRNTIKSNMVQVLFDLPIGILLL